MRCTTVHGHGDVMGRLMINTHATMRNEEATRTAALQKTTPPTQLLHTVFIRFSLKIIEHLQLDHWIFNGP